MSETNKSIDPNDNVVANNITAMKSRIIGTNKLFKILTSSKEDVNSKKEKIDELETILRNFRSELETKESELQKVMSEKNAFAKQLALYKSSNLQSTVNNLQNQLNEAETSKAAVEKVLYSKNMYINQLEAECEKVKNEANVNKNSKTVEKHRQDMTKKNQDIRLLQDQVAELNQKLEISEAENEKLDVENMALKMDIEEKEMDSNEKELQDKIDELENSQAESNKQVEYLKSKLIKSSSEKLNLQKMCDENAAKWSKKHGETHKEMEAYKLKCGKLQSDRIAYQQKYEQALKDIEMKKNTSSTHSTAQLSPNLLTKLRRWKANNALLKDENKYLKQRVEKLNMKFSKNQNLEDLLQTTSEEDNNDEEDDDFYMSNSPVGMSPPKMTSPIKMTSPTKMTSPVRPTKKAASASVSQINTMPSLPTHKSSLIVSPTSPVSSTSSTHVLEKSIISTENKDKAAFRTAGLAVPAPKLFLPPATRAIAVPKTKKATNRLVKFANSRNPSKVINSKPIVNPVSKRALSPEKSVTSEEETLQKKTRLDTRLADRVKNWISSRKVIKDNDIDIDEFLQEVTTNYSVMKSPSDPDSKEMMNYGGDCQFKIQIPDKWDGREKAYAWILCLMSNKKIENFQYIYEKLSEETTSVLKSKRPDVSSARYCRLLCMLCKSINDIERIRTLCYDVLRYSSCPTNAIVCLYNITCGWKECLLLDDKPSITLRSVQVCAASIVKKSKTPANVKAMYLKMATHCNWPSLESTSSASENIEFVFEQLLALENEDDMSVFNRNRFEIIKSFELIFHVIGDWKKMYNEFILNKLWPLLTRDIVDDLALETMAVLGTFGLSQDPTKEDQPGVQHLFDIMVQVATVVVAADDEKDIQLTAIKGAWMLGANDPARIAKIKQCVELINKS